MMTFSGNRKTHHFKWNEIRKVTYEGRVFIINLIINDVSLLSQSQIIQTFQ